MEVTEVMGLKDGEFRNEDHLLQSGSDLRVLYIQLNCCQSDADLCV